VSVRSEAEIVFEDHFSAILDEDGNVIPGHEDIPQYWQDDLHELADSLVPVYTSDLLDEWAAEGYPELEDEGLIEGTKDVVRIVMVVMYEQYTNALYEIARERGLDD